MHKLAPLALLLASCTVGAPDDTLPAPTCAWASRAHAGVLGAGEHLDGPAALGIEGDLILANPRAAFVIQAPEHERTYYHYGGLPIDAVAMAGCAQAGPERFGELGILPSRLDIGDFPRSVMRQLHGTTATIVRDGSDGGDAVVRVEGIDDAFWLVDFELSRKVAAGGGRRPLSGPLGAAWAITYTLPPDGAALRIDVEARNLTDAQNAVAAGVAVFPDASTPTFHYADARQSFGGFGLDLGMPWFTAAAGDGAYAIGLDAESAALAEVSGVRAIFDPAQLLSGSLTLEPAGTPGDTKTMGLFLAVGATDAQSAVDALLEARPTVGGQPAGARPLAGVVSASEDGAPLAGATVDVEIDRGGGNWRALHRMTTDAAGRFHGQVTWPVGDDRPRRLAVHAPGRPDPTPTALVDQATVDVAVDPGGVLRLHALDEHGAGLPARASVWSGATRVAVAFLPPDGADVAVAPGDYTVTLTRGYEHEAWREAITVGPGAVVARNPTLARTVDTTGWLSFDGHVHASPSADAPTPVDLRFATAAADGLEIVVHTEHEIIVDESDVLAGTPWSPWVASVVGEEVTATTPEHMNMYSVPVGPEDGARGNPVRWYGLGMDAIMAAMRDRGAGFRTLNHPKSLGGCSWMCLIDWNSVEARPNETDPTRFGLAPGTALWSWDFDGVELINGVKYIWHDASDPRGGGLFDDWQNFFHHGHRVTAVGVSDVHELDAPGVPRTYVPVPDESLAAFRDAWLVDALEAGAASISAGAFADVHVGAVGLGGTVTVSEGPVPVRVRVDAPAGVDVTHAVVFANCDAVADLPAADPHALRKIDTTVELALPADAQIVVAAFGEEPLPLGLEPVPPWVPRALTNPIFVDVDGNGTWDAPGGKTCDYDGYVPAPPASAERRALAAHADHASH